MSDSIKRARTKLAIKDLEKQLARDINALEKKMLQHAKNLEFEKEAAARDKLAGLKKKVFAIEAAEL